MCNSETMHFSRAPANRQPHPRRGNAAKLRYCAYCTFFFAGRYSFLIFTSTE